MVYYARHQLVCINYEVVENTGSKIHTVLLVLFINNFCAISMSLLLYSELCF